MDRIPTPDQVGRRSSAWWQDRVARSLVMVGGVSAIVFILAIFVFIARQGLGFAITELNILEFFGFPRVDWGAIYTMQQYYAAVGAYGPVGTHRV